MEEGSERKEKPIDIVASVLLIMVAGMNAVLKTVAVFSLAIPVIGEIIYPFALLFTIIALVGIIFYFVMKLGVFGSVGLAMTIGGILDALGLPIGLLGGTVLAIYLANHPKVAAVAMIATGQIAGAETAITKEAAVGVEKAAVEIEAGAGKAQQAGRGIEGIEKTAGRPGVTTAEPSETQGKPSEAPKPEKPEVPKEALGEKPTDFEKMQELFKKTPQVEQSHNEDENEKAA